MTNDEMTYCETHKTMNTRNIYGMLLCCKKKKPIGHEKTKPQTAMVISLWFSGLWCVLNIIVIGHYTINVPKSFQLFTVS